MLVLSQQGAGPLILPAFQAVADQAVGYDLPGVGHWIPEEATEEMLRRLTELFAR
ncbi:MAG: hypothetical protein H0V26_12910 [Solirubrobacterales bacterium]|nr:hypothetical protein [Solirubrobacterales bacterium]